MLQSLAVNNYEIKHKCAKVEALGNFCNEADRFNEKGTMIKRGDDYQAEQLLKIFDNLLRDQGLKEGCKREF